MTGFTFISLAFCVLVTSGAHLYDNTETPLKAVEEGEIIYYFCSQSNVDGTPIKFNELDSLPSSFDANKDVFTIIHGWWDNYDSDINVLVKNAVFESNDVNVLIVDWSAVSGGGYFTAKDGVPAVGAFVGYFFQNLTSKRNVPTSSIKMVGHSLGAHIAGIAGAMLGGEFDYIVGLDPALPFVDITDPSYCLDKSDARFVEVIHTSAGKLGIGESLGHVDYFPNGGSSQPGCVLDVVANCAHKRAYQYYAETLNNNEFYAKQCESYDDFTDGSCGGSISLMGGYSIDKSASGNNFLDTNNDTPYAKGEIN